MTTDPSREAFEKWVMRNPRPGTHLDRNKIHGTYKDNRVAAKWAAWQAAMAHRPEGAPAVPELGAKE